MTTVAARAAVLAEIRRLAEEWSGAGAAPARLSGRYVGRHRRPAPGTLYGFGWAA